MIFMLAEVIRFAISDGRIGQCSIREEWAICDLCRGSGGHSNRFGAYSAEEWNEHDDDFREEYLSGSYDARCEDCDGSGKVLVLDESELSDEARQYLCEYLQSEYESYALEQAERRAGC
jgi:RecJ-like exonuclease